MWVATDRSDHSIRFASIDFYSYHSKTTKMTTEQEDPVMEYTEICNEEEAQQRIGKL